MKKLILTVTLILIGSLLLFGQDAITVIANGNVGINNTEPTAKLEINGDARVNGEINAPLKLTDELSDEIIRNILKHLNPVGSIQAYGGTSDPDGYLICDGRELSPTDPKYADLFAVIGYNFGRGVDTNFRIPDLRGQFLRGADNGANRDTSPREALNVGNTTGLGSYQTDDNKAHAHNMEHLHENTTPAGEHSHNLLRLVSGTGVNIYGVSIGTISSCGQTANCSNNSWTGGYVSNQPNHTHAIPAFTGNTQATGGTESRPKNVAVNFIIKY